MAQAEFKAEYQKKVLDNGATIVTGYMPESELVTVQIRVLSGLSNEGKYAGTGISHFLEHLLFKGTREKSSEEVRREIKAMGGTFNGSTGLDSAVYYITVPNEHFEKALGLLADMVIDPAFTDEELEIEREVILSEIRLRNDDPITKRMRLLFSQAYRENVYKYPIIGYTDLFKGLSREDVEEYHSSTYTPDKMVVGIAGGVLSDEAIRVAEKKFSAYRRGPARVVNVPREPRQIDENITEFSADVVVGYMAMGFHTVDVYSEDLYATDVLSLLLSEGNDSRLYTRLVKEKELLYAISGGNYTPKYPGLFIISAIGSPENIEEARTEIFKIIEELKSGEIKERELERAKNLIIAQFLKSHESINTVASSMTSSELLTGDPAFFEKYVDEIKKVRKEQVLELASKYLTQDNSTTVLLMPSFFVKEEEAKEKILVKDEEGKMVTLKNGLRIIAKRKGKLPLVSVIYVTPGGLRAETAETSGISNLTASLLLKGTKKHREDEIIPPIEHMGGNIGAFSGMNSLGMRMTVMSDDLSSGMDIFEDVVRNALFPASEIEKQKTKILAAIKEQEKSIFENGVISLRRLLYGDHPYGRRIIGEINTVENISRDEIIRFYRERFSPEGSVLVVVGDIDVDETIQEFSKRFVSWRGKSASIGEETVAPIKKKRTEDIVMRKEQSLILMGFLGVEVTDRRKFDLSVISSILSGTDGLLFHQVREEEGLTYTAGAANVPGVDPGYFTLYVATKEENIKKTQAQVLDVVKRVKEGKITDEEISSSRKRLVAQHAQSIETNESLSMIMALDELYGMGFQNYKSIPEGIYSVTKDDIVRTTGEILNVDESALVIIHSEE